MHVRLASSFLMCSLMAHADVSYDVIQSVKWPPAATDPKTPWTHAGTFAISPKLYAPVLDGTPQEVIHVRIKDQQLLVLESGTSHIYDLQSATVTTVHLQSRTYSTESLDAAYQQYRQAARRKRVEEFSVSVRKTGNTVRLYDQDAVEFEIVVSRKSARKNKTAVRSLCWTAGRAPSAELEEFRKNWLARTKLPFPVDTLLIDSASDAYLAIVNAQATIPGYVLGFVTEARTEEPQLDLYARPSAAYQARTNQLPFPHPSGNPGVALGLLPYDPIVYPLAPHRLLQINLLNFTESAVGADAFLIPAGSKRQK